MRPWPALLLLLAVACLHDRDEDGFLSDVDCDDDDVEIHPDATELCDDVDNDCDDEVDEPDALDAFPWWVDADGDGYGDPERLAKACEEPEGWADNGDDCDDQAASVHPGATEVPGDGVDNDCSTATPD